MFTSDSVAREQIKESDVTEHDVTAHDVTAHDATDAESPTDVTTSTTDGNSTSEHTVHVLSETTQNTGSGLSKSLDDVTAEDSQSSSPPEEHPQTDSEDDMLDAVWLRNKIVTETNLIKTRPRRRKAFSESEASNRSERCDLCGETFNSALQLRRHVMTHTRQRSLDLPSKRVSEPPVQCPVCKKVFENVTYLEKHKLRRHSSEKHRCDVCLLTFDTKKLRDAHRRSHFGENPFSCQIT